MNLYKLELKRVCKTRMTAILLAIALVLAVVCLLYTSPSPRDYAASRMPSSA